MRKGRSPCKGKLENSGGHGKGRGSYRGRGHGATDKGHSMIKSITKVLFSIDIARNLATKKLNVEARKVKSTNPTLLRTLQDRATCSWAILLLAMTLMKCGSWTMGAQIICPE